MQLGGYFDLRQPLSPSRMHPFPEQMEPKILELSIPEQ